jgi:hypothetical protein
LRDKINENIFFPRIFEDVKEELLNMYQEREALEYRSENDNYEKVKLFLMRNV